MSSDPHVERDRDAMAQLQLQQFSSSSQPSSAASTQQTSHLSSPSKSLKLYLKNRMSMKSIDSISEVPEIVHDDHEGLVPSASPTKISGLLLRPLFLRSKSSIMSESSYEASSMGAATSGRSARAPSVSPSKLVHLLKPVQVNDFADSSSGSADYDSESINSILDEYGHHNQRPTSVFIFHEDLDATVALTAAPVATEPTAVAPDQENVAPKTNRLSDRLNQLLLDHRSLSSLEPQLLRSRKTKSLIELQLVDSVRLSLEASRTSYYDAKQSEGDSSSSSNGRLHNRIHHDAAPAAIRRDRKKVISASSNVDVVNRSSLYNLSTISDIHAAAIEPATAADALERPLAAVPGPIDTTAYSDEKVIAKSSTADKSVVTTSNTDTFSLSSGELLNTLQSFYAPGGKDGVNGAAGRSGYSVPAGVRAKLVDVRPGVTSNLDNPSAPSLATPVHQIFIDKPRGPASSCPDGHAMSSFVPGTEPSEQRLHDFVAIKPPTRNSHVQDSIERQTSHERMLYEGFEPIYDNYGEKRPEVPATYTPATGTLKSAYNQHSWTRFILLCMCGLLAPPIYFLLAMGSFDSRSLPSQCYANYYYTGEQAIVRRKFSKVQKCIAVAIGLLWCAIAFAMIGVGVGIGQKRET